MLNSNRLSVELTTTDIQDIEQALDTLESKLSFLEAMPEEERAHKIRLGTQNMTFLQVAKEAYIERPHFLPGISDPQDFENDFDLFFALRPVRARLEMLTQSVEDTTLQAGSDAYRDALGIFRNAKDGMKRGIDGGRFWANKLKVRFEQELSSSEEEDEVPKDGQPDNGPVPDSETGDNG